MEAILGILVIYNPDIDKLIDNINQFIDKISMLIIWQNSELSDSQKQIIEVNCICREKIVWKGDSTNQGLDTAFNFGLKLGIENNYKWLLTMDQDSKWINFDMFLDSVKECTDSSAGIFGPKTINAFDSQLTTHNSCGEFSKVEYVISSGALYSIDKLQKIGGFVKGYFIDAIDEEICYRGKAFGVSTLMVNNAFLKQEFGSFSKTRIFGKVIASSNYSPFRYYYIARNHIWLAKSGFVQGTSRKLIIYNYVLAPFVKVILVESQKIAKCKSILRGVFAGLTKKPMGEKNR